jgi:preprotein translocase SecF subunit|tara:strand:- start:649 stop:1542 length:894 start_codon:yes stop_codon:yes gene_type:complete
MKNNYEFNKYNKVFNYISIFISVISIVFLLFKGLNFGVDFKGGTLIEIRIDNINVKTQDVRNAFNKLNLEDLTVKKFGNDTDYIVKFKRSDLNNPNFIQNLKKDLNIYLEDYTFRRVENVGPKVSSELLLDGILAIAIALSAMLIYIWFRFEWQFSLGAIIAIFHDVLITLGIFSALNLEINLSIVAAVLTIVGYSMNDTVVIFDRVRENLKKYSKIQIDELTNLSINETLSRTLITSVTTLLALFSIFLFGGEILKGFSFAMILGVILGTYSSIYIANPILIFLRVSQKTLIKEEN